MPSRLSRCAGWSFWVCALVRVFIDKPFTLRIPIHWGKARESGAVVPLLIIAAVAPWRPSRAGAGDGSHSVSPKTVKFGGCAPHLMWEMEHRAGTNAPTPTSPRGEGVDSWAATWLAPLLHAGQAQLAHDTRHALELAVSPVPQGSRAPWFPAQVVPPSPHARIHTGRRCLPLTGNSPLGLGIAPSGCSALWSGNVRMPRPVGLLLHEALSQPNPAPCCGIRELNATLLKQADGCNTTKSEQKALQ